MIHLVRAYRETWPPPVAPPSLTAGGCIAEGSYLPSSDQAEALVLLHSASQAAAQDVFGLVAGHVQQVVAGVGHRQVVLLSRGGLDDDTHALHAVDGDAVAAGQEHCEPEEVKVNSWTQNVLNSIQSGDLN